MNTAFKKFSIVHLLLVAAIGMLRFSASLAQLSGNTAPLFIYNVLLFFCALFSLKLALENKKLRQDIFVYFFCVVIIMLMASQAVFKDVLGFLSLLIANIVFYAVLAKSKGAPFAMSAAELALSIICSLLSLACYMTMLFKLSLDNDINLFISLGCLILPMILFIICAQQLRLSNYDLPLLALCALCLALGINLTVCVLHFGTSLRWVMLIAMQAFFALFLLYIVNTRNYMLRKIKGTPTMASLIIVALCVAASVVPIVVFTSHYEFSYLTYAFSMFFVVPSISISMLLSLIRIEQRPPID